MQRKPHLFTVLVLAGAALGLFFAGFSTYDFARHLDRQVHAVNCSFIPGLAATDARSDCHVTMMSHYSSVMRDVVWGGIPISLPAMSVFAFLLLFTIELCITRRQEDHRATAFLALAALLPAAASIIMAIIAFSKLDAACKLCIGIYFSSALTLLGALCMWRRAEQARRADELGRLSQDGDPREPLAERSNPFAATAAVPPDDDRRLRAQVHARGAAPVGMGYLAAAFGLGVLLVAVPAAAYVALAPDHSVFIGACGDLVEDKDAYNVMVPFDRHQGGVPTVEVLDPLCPSCRAFERRLEASGLRDQLDRSAILFPLDKECNWMVDDRKHPGACAVSEAVLCAGEHAGEVVEWAFGAQDEIRASAEKSDDGARALARDRFPDLARCIGSAGAKSKLNKSLRWAVRNQLPVLTPQLYVAGVKLCDEDIDLGMEFALSRMIERARAGTLKKRGAK
ncbi:MAG TPA: vitamin K epoxide reductase family protein [Kofleriaceae bacterium]|nr:vitamin K epoxide reductase family protein [Kofleriaceae bacterium]